MRSRIRKTDFEGVFGNVAAINDSHTIIAFAKPLAKLLKEYGVRTEGPKRACNLTKILATWLARGCPSIGRPQSRMCRGAVTTG